MSVLVRTLPSVVLAALLLASCQNVKPVPPSSPIASVTGEEAKTTTAAVAALAHPVQDPAHSSTPGPATPEPAPGVVVRHFTPANSDKRFEIVEITVNIKEPRTQSRLVPYLMNLDEWMITKCIHISPMEKLYRFQRVVPKGTQAPTVDPFNRKPPEPQTGVKFATPQE